MEIKVPKQEQALEIIWLIELAANDAIRRNRPELAHLKSKHNGSLEAKASALSSQLLNDDEDCYLVVEENGKIVAYAHGAKFRKQGTLHSLYVLPLYQRKKVGTLIMNEMLKWFQDSVILLCVPPSNPEAIQFYRQFGFVIDVEGDHDRSYGDGLGVGGTILRKDP